MGSLCPRCSTETPVGAATCSSCGEDLLDLSRTPTGTAPRPRSATPSAGAASQTALPKTRFAPGTLLADRYRVISLVGKGGMGEVYRVDDIRLGQSVALKFLPPGLQADPERLERLYGEVRVARQISHPNVCRVYDVGEVEGQPFLSMEYVDGEDLASLLRRIGRLPSHKAIEISQQLCAGLTAAHERNVLHRDLKPENIMLDGRGQVRITDFGLAGLADSFEGDELRSGTPAYMSPEQLGGLSVDARSDIYALGLVLYQLFTGRRAFEGRTLAEISRLHEGAPPPRPSSLVEGLDPAVERTILRCLEKDPAARPPSPRAVAASLPGGDPLAAALAAGETPSPELVAAAGDRGGLSTRAAALALVGAFLTAGLALRVAGSATLLGLIPAPKPTAALEDTARTLLRKLGYPDPADEDRGFFFDNDYVAYIAAHDPSPGRWEALREGRPAGIHFWYRGSPHPMVSLALSAVVRPDTPDPTTPGMTGVELDPAGRLLKLYAVTPQLETPPPTTVPSPDFAALLTEAGFDTGTLTPALPRWTPPFFVDTRKAWDGAFPDGRPAHLEAAAYRGRVAFFQVSEEWTRPDRSTSDALPFAMQVVETMGFVLIVVVVLGAMLLARRNLRLGRGDVRGGSRLARYVLATVAIVWVLEAHHVSRFDWELGLVAEGTGLTLTVGGLVWLLYMALEPPVRRRAPLRIVSWSRILAGRFRDPLVGRDVLIGVLWGCVKSLMACLVRTVPRHLGSPPTTPLTANLDPLVGARIALGDLLGGQLSLIALVMGFLLLFLILQALLKREWLAALVLVLLIGAQGILAFVGPASSPAARLVYGAYGLLSAGIVVGVLLRNGLVACIVLTLVQNILVNFPVTLHSQVWYWGTSLFYLLVLSALALFGFWTARGGEPLFGGELLGD
jgi:hypothetical protein